MQLGEFTNTSFVVFGALRVNLPQNVNELASSLPRYPKDLSVIIVKVKGRNDTFKDVNV